MKYAGCCVPVSALRKESSHRSEMVSQLLFGECCTVLEEGPDNWVKIKCRYDDYEGWCLLSHLVEIDEENNVQADKAFIGRVEELCGRDAVRVID